MFAVKTFVVILESCFIELRKNPAFYSEKDDTKPQTKQ